MYSPFTLLCKFWHCEATVGALLFVWVPEINEWVYALKFETSRYFYQNNRLTTQFIWISLQSPDLDLFEASKCQLCICQWRDWKLWFHQKGLHLCSEDGQKSYRLEITWGWVINDRIKIFGWNITLRDDTLQTSSMVLKPWHLAYHGIYVQKHSCYCLWCTYKE